MFTACLLFFFILFSSGLSLWPLAVLELTGYVDQASLQLTALFLIPLSNSLDSEALYGLYGFMVCDSLDELQSFKFFILFVCGMCAHVWVCASQYQHSNVAQDNFVEPVLFFHIYVASVTSSGRQTCEAVSFTCSAISSALPYTLLGHNIFPL